MMVANAVCLSAQFYSKYIEFLSLLCYNFYIRGKEK